MKKNLFIFIIILAVFQVKAYSQTLTAIDCNPRVGDVFNYSTGPAVPPGSAGIGQLWDFSAYSYTASAPVTMSASGSVLGSSYFLNSNIASTDGYASSTFFSASSGSLEIVGLTTVYDITIFQNPELLLIYPFSFGNSTSDTYANVAYIPSTHTTSATKTITADGTGTLITPAGTFNNVLRVHIIEQVTTFFTQSNTSLQINENYYWYKPGIHGELFAAFSSTNDVQNPPPHSSTQSSKYLSNAVVYLGIGSYEAFPNAMKLFPNPASNELNVELTPQVPSNFTIINSLGGVLLEETIETLENTRKIDISAIKAGLYILQVKSDNKIIAQKKFIIAE